MGLMGLMGQGSDANDGIRIIMIGTTALDKFTAPSGL